MRKMDNQKLPKEWCQNLMAEITGTGADLKGGECGGAVAKALVAPENLEKYVGFYCLFRTLSKMVYLAMTQRKELNFKRKIASGSSQEGGLDAEIESCTLQLDALCVKDLVKTEMDRMFEGESRWLEAKAEQAAAAIAKYTAQKDCLLDSYFGDLPQ